jgi:hypothetical protein
MSFPSEGQLEGIRVQLRLLVSHAPEQRFDTNGTEVLQLRGRVMDATSSHPQVVVRFAGQRRSELYRWAAPGKHLSVDGQLEVKTWHASDDHQHVALLIEALNIYPLSEPEPDLRRVGIYALPGHRGASLEPGPSLSKAQRAEQLRRALDQA